MGYLSPISQTLLFFSLFLFLINKIEIGKEKKLFILYINIAFLAEITGVVTMAYQIKNAWLWHLYFPIEFLLFFFILLQWENQYRKYWIAAGVLVGTYVLLDYFYLTDFLKYPVMGLSIQGFFFFLFSVRMLIEITTRNFIPFYKDERFYIVAGIFVYSSLTSLMYLFYNVFNILFPFYVVTLAGVSLNLFFTYAMVFYYKRRKILEEALK